MTVPRCENGELIVGRPHGDERHSFATCGEAAARAAFLTEALSWVGTPFVDCGDIKGPGGAVDCAMLLVRCAVDTGHVPPFDPRPYSPRWMMHRREEKFLDWLARLGAVEIAEPRPADIVVWQWCNTFAHGAILLNRDEVIHAYASAGQVVVSRRDEPLLTHLPVDFAVLPRPVRYFTMWG